jgi:hypothetical protein
MENFIFKDGIPWWYFIAMIALLVMNIFLYHAVMKQRILKGKYPENFFKWMFWRDGDRFTTACNFFAWGWFLYGCFRLVITLIYK